MDKIIDSLYLHFPFCTHLCNYCDFYKKIPQDKSLDFNNFHQYLDAAFFEHESLMKTHGYSFAPLKTFYIGGGTPSFWGVEGALFLENFFKTHDIKLDKDCEFTLEVNPGAWTNESLNHWQKLGANRFSLGIQTLNPELLVYLDRSHPYEEILKTLNYFKENQLNFSMDFMIGLPHSDGKKRDVIHELNYALEFNPSHFSVYILTVKENYKYFKQLPSEEWIEEEFLKVADFLKKNNFKHYEVSNFSLENKKSKHNLRYWRADTVAAFGPSATGYLAGDNIRYKWKTNSTQFELENLSKKEVILEKIYLGLRSEIGLELNFFPEKNESFLKIIENWKKRSYATVEDGRVFLTSKGYLLLDSLMNDLFINNLVE